MPDAVSIVLALTLALALLALAGMAVAFWFFINGRRTSMKTQHKRSAPRA